MYQSYSQELLSKLNSVQKRNPGCMYVEIAGFRNGSIICDYRCFVRATDSRHDIKSFFEKNVSATFDNMTFNGKHLKKKFLKSNDVTEALKMMDNMCNAIGVCAPGLQCSGGSSPQTIRCQSPCTKDYCTNGRCFVDSNNEPKCSCYNSTTFVYSGDRCQMKSEQFAMSKHDIIAVAAGVASALLLLLAIALVCICLAWRKRRKRNKDEKESEQGTMDEEVSDGDGSIGSMDTDPAYVFSQGGIAKRYSAVSLDYSLPGVISPTSQPSLLQSDYRGVSVYTHINTEPDFAIKRPEVR
ncbi:mucin-3B-like [Haliotis rubra]|uniref:mucin-3B-like n=1 Tax=Haliotis rubra TaxID=36100 RepID=UPI001EE600F0|nr:mucin-3B-like [Haliotis rubra]